MKLDLSAMKKENHLMEIRLNEQMGSHEDLKEEFRYLMKQAKWGVAGVQKEEMKIEPRAILGNLGNHPVVDNLKQLALLPVVKDSNVKADAAEDTEALNRALRHVNSDDVADEETGADTDAIDLSKRSHVLIVSERYGGGDVLGKLFSYDDTLFFLPALSGIAKSRVDLDKIAHCSFTENVVQFYKTHPGVLMSSKSLSKFCAEGKCDSLTARNLEKECLSKQVTVMEGLTEHWTLDTLSNLPMEIAYVTRDPRAVISRLREDEIITEEEIQVYAGKLCSRTQNYRGHTSSTHNGYQVVEYEKLASSPVTQLSQVYHQLLDHTDLPIIPLSREYKNELYLSVGDWRNKLPQISLDAIEEECRGVIAAV